LEQALRIAQAIWDNFAGKGAAPHQIAIAIDMTPTSGTWRNLCGASIAYGLSTGGYNATEITLTELGKRIVAPIEEGDDRAARAVAVLKPRISKSFFERYNRAKFPKDEIAKNVLVGMGLPKERADRALEILKKNGESTGLITQTKSGAFIALDGVIAASAKMTETEPDTDGNDSQAPEFSPRSVKDDSIDSKDRGHEHPKQLFVAHGKNRKALEELKRILEQFKIPHLVAVDEPHAGRPISQKVADLMRDCSAGIFIFTRDEKFVHENGEEVWRPSENVVYELGAAGILWDRKIIILRENGVNFPSDFSDLGYITFDDGALALKALDLLKELVALGLVKVQAA
jgi:predicted nucleotide-binding protein